MIDQPQSSLFKFGIGLIGGADPEGVFSCDLQSQRVPRPSLKYQSIERSRRVETPHWRTVCRLMFGYFPIDNELDSDHDAQTRLKLVRSMRRTSNRR